MRGGMTDAELVERLREWFRLKGDPALREAADRLEMFSGAKLDALGKAVAEDQSPFVEIKFGGGKKPLDPIP